MQILKKTSIGLDIADYSIEVVKLQKSGHTVEVVSKNRIELEDGIVSNGTIIDEDKLAVKIKKLFSEAKPEAIETEEIIFGLPESQVYTHIFPLPNVEKDDLEKTILNEVQISVPINSNDLSYSYKIREIEKSDNKDQSTGKEVIVVAGSISVMSKWKKFFQDSGFKLEFFDIETLASFRSLYKTVPKAAVCVIDLGAVRTTTSIFDKTGLRTTFSTVIAGDEIDRQIASDLRISINDARNKKIKNGLMGSDKLVRDSIVKTLEPLIVEIKKFIEGFEIDSKNKIVEVTLIGGLAKMEGIIQLFADRLGIETKIGETKLIGQGVPLVYLGAIGLALRNIEKKWNEKDPNILAPDIEKIKKERERLIKKEEIKKVETKSKSVGVSSITKIKNYKLKKQKILLGIVLIVGVILIGLLIWNRNSSRDDRIAEVESKLVSYSQTQTFSIRVPIAVDESHYSTDRVKGRVFTDEIESFSDLNEALQNSKRKVQKNLKDGEVVWGKPLGERFGGDNIDPPIKIQWLIFNDKEANDLLVAEINKINSNNVDFQLNNILKTSIEPSDNTKIFYLNADIVISVNDLIEVTGNEELDNLTEDTTKDSETVYTVIILDTPVGHLNVRSGPGVSFEKIAEVSPGEEYSVFEEEGDWVNIRINDELKGWVITRYVKKK